MKKLLKNLSLIPDTKDIKIILISFLIINFAFLYHTLNFMWGNHDVKFIKKELLLSSGLFEGRFTQFIPYRLFVDGQILPILNNFIGFTFLTLALWLLAKYWNIKKSILNYILFITFFATQPYTLSWMYFTFITISCLSWTFFAILGLYLSHQIPFSKNKLILTILSIICFYLPLGGYPPIINTFFVCLSAKITLDYIFENKSLKDLFNIYKYTILNILIATILYKISLSFVPHNDVYNLETTPIKELPLKFIACLKISFQQFLVTVPFMEIGYKIILFSVCIIATIGCLLKSKTPIKYFLSLLFITTTIWFTALTTFLVVPPTEYVSRIDFYGFGFLYAFFLCLLLRLTPKIYESLSLIFCFILIPLNILNDYHALKIWKQGFDAEFQILDKVTEKIENHPLFNPNKKYRIYIAGDISLRPSYYNGKFQKDDVFFYSLPYLAMWQGANLVQFYSPYNYISNPSIITPEDITPDVYNFITKDAHYWPHENSIFINNNIIIVIYNRYGLEELKQKIKIFSP